VTTGLVTWRRRAAWAALIGLLMQIVLPFAHVHAIALQADNSAPVLVERGTSSPLGPEKNPTTSDEDHCPLCLVVHQAGTLILPDPVRAPVPPLLGSVGFVEVNAFELSRPEYFLFQTRAPPNVA
jgi:Protein of unknown function (DUF2946)